MLKHRFFFYEIKRSARIFEIQNAEENLVNIKLELGISVNSLFLVIAKKAWLVLYVVNIAWPEILEFRFLRCYLFTVL
jgi:hypothetical protein